MEVDWDDLVYAGTFEHDAIEVYIPLNGTVSIFVRDSRIGWPDSPSVGTDGLLYFLRISCGGQQSTIQEWIEEKGRLGCSKCNCQLMERKFCYLRRRLELSWCWHRCLANNIAFDLN